MCQTENKLKTIEKALEFLALLCLDPRIARLIAHPACEQQEVVACLLKLHKTSRTTENLLKVLARHKRLNLIPSISSQLKDTIQSNKGRASAKIYSAYELSSKQINRIHALLEKRYHKQFDSSVELDKSLLGGVVIQYGNNRIDGSIRGFINQMYQSLCSSGETL